MYGKVLSEIYGLEARGVRLGLSRMRRALALLDNPHKNYRCILVGGTNGKGSVSAMLASILGENERVGLYTSPHLLDFRERVQVNGTLIPKKDVVRLYGLVKRKALPKVALTFFEAVTLIAFLHFREKKVSVAVLEVGMGGRLDATNVVDAELSVITNVEIEHTQFLGSTVKKIAYEKAGIIRKNAVLVTTETKPAAVAVLKRVCGERHCRLVRAPAAAIMKRSRSSQQMKSNSITITTSLLGDYQQYNVACAVAAARELGIDEKSIKAGIKTARWPGRMQRAGRFILDAAHNPAGMKALASSLSGKYVAVIGIADDKDADRMLRAISPKCKKIIVTRAYHRGRDVASLARMAGKYCRNVDTAPTVKAAMKQARKERGPILVAGSIFLLEEALTWMRSG